MKPKDFYDRGTLYTLDIESEIYELSPIGEACFRIDSDKSSVGSGNYNFKYSFFDYHNKPLTLNGWTLYRMQFHKAWNDNYPPSIDVIDPKGIQLSSYPIPKPFAKEEYTGKRTRENRLSETYRFFKYISQYKSIYDFKLLNDPKFSTVEDVMHYYLEYLKIRDRLTDAIKAQVEDKLKSYCEKYLSQK